MTHRASLAVVGSTRFKIPSALKYARDIIEGFFFELNPIEVISGGAVGIDSLAISLAKMRHIATVEYLPRFRRWEPDGYKDRNLMIATECTHLLRITCHSSKTYWSGWTRDRAKEMGKIIVGDFVL